MLKITYTETGLHLEQFSESLEEWLPSRLLLALRAGQPCLVEPCSASLLLPIELVRRSSLEQLLQAEVEASLALCDAEHLEVSLRGIWLTFSSQESDGVFLANLSNETEQLLLRLWQESQLSVSSRC